MLTLIFLLSLIIFFVNDEEFFLLKKVKDEWIYCLYKLECILVSNLKIKSFLHQLKNIKKVVLNKFTVKKRLTKIIIRFMVEISFSVGKTSQNRLNLTLSEESIIKLRDGNIKEIEIASRKVAMSKKPMKYLICF